MIEGPNREYPLIRVKLDFKTRSSQVLSQEMAQQEADTINEGRCTKKIQIRARIGGF